MLDPGVPEESGAVQELLGSQGKGTVLDPGVSMGSGTVLGSQGNGTELDPLGSQGKWNSAGCTGFPGTGNSAEEQAGLWFVLPVLRSGEVLCSYGEPLIGKTVTEKEFLQQEQ